MIWSEDPEELCEGRLSGDFLDELECSADAVDFEICAELEVVGDAVGAGAYGHFEAEWAECGGALFLDLGCN